MFESEFEHALRKRRRKQHVQPLIRRRQPPHDVADVGDEAQVEHAIGFVQDHDLDGPQVEHALLVEIDEPPGRADQDVDAVLEHAALLVVVDAAEGQAEREARVLAEDLGVVVDLHGQLARGRDDDGARRIDRTVGRGVLAQQVCVHCNEERGGLAGARLGLSGNVETGEGARQCLRLDPGAALEAGVSDAAGERLGQMEVGKGNFAEVSV